MDAARPTQARLTLLGGFDLCAGADPVRLSRAAQRVLALLAVVHRDKPVSRTTLAERLWPDTPPERAAASLRSALWRMPRLRGRPLVTPFAAGVRLAPEVEVDLWEAEDRVRVLCGEVAPDLQALEDLSFLDVDLLPAWYDEWLLVEQESFRQRRVHALEHCSEALRDRGRYTEALTAALAAVRCEPLRESAHRRVIEVHLVEGNQSEALRQYDVYRKLLATELGLAPSPVIRRLVAPLLGRPADG